MAYDYDLFVIGAGSGGVRAARVAAMAGASRSAGVSRSAPGQNGHAPTLGPSAAPLGLCDSFGRCCRCGAMSTGRPVVGSTIARGD